MRRDPDAYGFFEIVDGFEDMDGDHVLLVREATADEETAVTIEEMFDTFGQAFVFVLPKGSEVDRDTKARIAERAGVDFTALANARRSYHQMLADPGQGHFQALGVALGEIWD